MTREYRCLLAVSAAVAVSGCGGGRPGGGAQEPDSLSLLLEDWSGWAEGSDDGLWESDSSRSIHFAELSAFGGDEPSPPFFSIESFDVSGDTVIVTDRQSEQLVALRSTDGSVLWRTGQPGEGPGCFTSIGQVDCSGGLIALANQGMGRIDLFSRDGTWLESIPFMQPYDLCFLEDSLLAVVSLADPEALVTLVRVDGETLSAFGTWDHPSAALPPANRNLHCALVAPGILAVTSYYANHIQLMDLRGDSTIRSFSRNLPVAIPEPAIGGSGGMTTFSLQTWILDVAAGPSGTVDVLLRPFDEDRQTIEGPDFEPAGVSIVDRFDLEGHYLDSYAIPGSIDQLLYSDSVLYAADWRDSRLVMFGFAAGPVMEPGAD